MIALAPTVERLKEAGFAHVEGLLEFVGLEQAPRISPALYVVPERETAQPNRMSGVIDQKVAETFSVILVVAAARRAEKVAEDLKLHCDAVENAMVGWKHPEAKGACEFAGSRLLSVDGQRACWAMSFSASRHIRRESQ